MRHGTLKARMISTAISVGMILFACSSIILSACTAEAEPVGPPAYAYAQPYDYGYPYGYADPYEFDYGLCCGIDYYGFDHHHHEFARGHFDHGHFAHFGGGRAFGGHGGFGGHVGGHR